MDSQFAVFAMVHPMLTFSQPVQAFQHPKFHEMIAVASRAQTGVKVAIPTMKTTHVQIINMFQDHLLDVKKHLNVSFISTSSECLTKVA